MVRGITTGVALMLLAGLAEAQVYKCNGADGRTVYQQQPCAEDTEGEAVREISITPGMPDEQRQQLEEMQAARAQQESPDYHQQASEAYQRFRQIQRDNADPERCQAARSDIMWMQQRGEPEYSTDLFMAKERVKLYCNP